MTLVPAPNGLDSLDCPLLPLARGLRRLDQTLVLYTLIFVVIVSMAVVALAAQAVLRLGRSRGARAQALGGILAAMPVPSSTRPSTIDLAPNLAGAAAPTSAASGALAPTSSSTLPEVAALNGRSPSDSRLPSGPLSPHNDAMAESTNHPPVHDDGTHEAEDDAAYEPLVDPATGFATRRVWDEVFRREEHRFARYGRPVTLLVAELEGLDALDAMLGEGEADRLILTVAATMRRSARVADFLARTGRTRFVAMLPETDEVAAINYVERVRSACDMWLEASGVAVRLAVGWAQPIAGGCLADAMRLAVDRMNADRLRQCIPAAPTTELPRRRRRPSWPVRMTRGTREGGGTGDL